MSENLEVGNSIKPLANVALLSVAIRRLVDRQFGLPGIGVFHGPPGFGKTYAAAHAAASNLGAIHVAVQKMWTKKTLLEQILVELGIEPRGTLANMMMTVNQGLAVAGRPLIIDEADYAVDRNMIEVIRDMHDGSDTPVMLIGMEKLPQKLRKWELVDSRVLSWTAAQPADLTDVQMLADAYAPGLDLDDSMLNHLIERNKGVTRKICTDLAYVVEQAKDQGWDTITKATWGNAEFLRSAAPQPRMHWS